MVATLGWISLAGLAAVGAWVFGVTPPDDLMGVSQKIMYLHVPSVWVAYLSFFIVFFCSVGYLWKRSGPFDQVARSSAEIGVIFCGLGILTGAVWGRPTWGTYWVWDARLTTTLLLLMIYSGYLVLRAFSDPGEKQARLAAVVGIVGFLDIPLIHLSVQWWRTLHQPSSVFKVAGQGAPKPAMPPELLYPLFAALAVMTVFFVFLLLYRIQIETENEELEEGLAGG
ncbi:MAG: cytochrome c biogenesis protein CcsA [bacterium]